jgi:predicted nucleic-acid-binding Zn-ribbon protein
MNAAQPKTCPNCGARTRLPQTIDYTTTVKLDRRVIDVHVPELHIEACTSCGEQYFGSIADREIDEALRRSAGLLTVTEIADGMQRVQPEFDCFDQQTMAKLIGSAPETVSRWMNGHVVQSRLADTFLRVFFGVPEARRFLQRHSRRSSLPAGERIVFPTKPMPLPERLMLTPPPVTTECGGDSNDAVAA